MELLTAIAACAGALTGMVSEIGVLIVNSKVDRLTGHVDTLEKAVIAKLRVAGPLIDDPHPIRAAGGAA